MPEIYHITVSSSRTQSAEGTFYSLK